jgi:cation diffusion facilitator CzcD-associated flavoprotein CzcO
MTEQREHGEGFDAVVVGAGFGGLYMLYRLLRLGLRVRVFEAGSGVGGTWYWNRYPGARCDVESLEYSYSFSEELQQQWEWTERFASQPEILRYLEHVADRFELKQHIQFDTRVEQLVFDESTALWSVRANGVTVRARFCVMATGCLSAANVPDIAGLGEFRGEIYHTGRWPHTDVDFSGKRVGIIGTGSSAVQSIPIIAAQAKHLYVFQRTPNFSIPARNHPLDPAVQTRMKADYARFRRQQRATAFGAGPPAREQSALQATPDELKHHYDERWSHGGLTFIGAFADLLTDEDANETAARYVNDRIRDIVVDPNVAALLCPDHLIGTKRLCSDTQYYETFNRDNVTLVDVRTNPIQRISAGQIVTTNEAFSIDALIFATGFDAMTGSLDRIDIRGRSGQALKRKWKGGPRAYLGLATAGFPNLLMMTGPGSPSVLANMATGVEQHAEWISNCIAHLLDHGYAFIEATETAEEEWATHVAEVGETTLFPRSNSWYVGANIPGKSRVFLPYIGGFARYEETCNDIAARGYAGFRLG